MKRAGLSFNVADTGSEASDQGIKKGAKFQQFFYSDQPVMVGLVVIFVQKFAQRFDENSKAGTAGKAAVEDFGEL